MVLLMDLLTGLLIIQYILLLYWIFVGVAKPIIIGITTPIITTIVG